MRGVEPPSPAQRENPISRVHAQPDSLPPAHTGACHRCAPEGHEAGSLLPPLSLRLPPLGVLTLPSAALLGAPSHGHAPAAHTAPVRPGSVSVTRSIASLPPSSSPWPHTALPSHATALPGHRGAADPGALEALARPGGGLLLVRVGAALVAGGVPGVAQRGAHLLVPGSGGGHPPSPTPLAAFAASDEELAAGELEFTPNPLSH